MASSKHVQEPVAIVGLACRLPGGNNSPHKLWEFLERGAIASNKVPESRFNMAGHWDGSLKPRTMRPSGGMFLEGVDPADFDASFFEISRAEAISMDPNQRQMLEVVFEGLENAGIPLESLSGASVGCFVGSYASDYGDMQGRDPEDRPASITVGVGRAIMANRLSHFLNTKGPSMTLDTACSGSLVALDVACRYLEAGDIDAAVIAASNLYLNPEHVMDIGAVGHAHSPTGLCHTFDRDADGYVKAEAVSAIIVKRLSDAVRDGDPIRAIVRGSATNSDGRTPGIASPSADAQAAAIRAAYASAGITGLDDTAYLECHGTGTQAGDPTEVSGASSVFAETRPADKPLIIGSIKSNIGHAEPAAGLSGLIKATLAIERGVIPGTPTFLNPNPKIDFAGLKVRASRAALPWPECSIRRASVNSFGYGGSNAHVVLEQPSPSSSHHHVSSYLADDDGLGLDDDDDDVSKRPYTLVVSANDNASLRANIKALCNHLFNPRVNVSLADLAHTLADRRTRFWHRAFVTARSTELDESAFVVGKKSSEAPRLGFVFTGQGAQWPQMGKALVDLFPWTRTLLDHLDGVLQSLPDPPSWSLLDELTEARTAEHLRQPEFSQPLVTALQLCLVAVLDGWGIKPQAVVGHSSGEIAAACAAGFLTPAAAIKAAFYRGRAAVNCKDQAEGDVGMLAVGLGADDLAPYLERHAGLAWIACFNSPSSLTVSGRRPALEALADDLKADKHFARLLQVDLAYHSELMEGISQEYERLLDGAEFASSAKPSGAAMFSSVTGGKRTTATDALYWKTNMSSPVRFDRAVQEMLADADAPNFLVEIGPSGALAGPVSQILKSTSSGSDVSYCAAWSRGGDADRSMFDLAGRLFIAGDPVDISRVNQSPDTPERPRTVIDLPNYSWNHSVKYWHENAASKDWRFKQFTNHDLLGSKVLGTLWTAPTWRKLLDVADLPWLKDHKMGSDILMPGAGFISMAVEALYQKTLSTSPDNVVIRGVGDLCYKLRDVRFHKALVLEEGKDAVVLLSLAQQNDWHEFRISSSTDDVLTEHCSGRVRVEDPADACLAEADKAALKFPTPSRVWYRAQEAAGYGFGPAFQKLLKVESVSGRRHCRSLVSLDEPESKWSPQSGYSIHPAALDGCFQTVTPSLWSGEPSSLTTVLVPAMIDELVINKISHRPQQGLSLASSEYSGRGRLEEAKSYFSNCRVHDPASGALLMQMKGLRFAKLDVGDKPDPHVFDCVSWKPDISFLSQDRLSRPGSAAREANARTIIDLIAHKTPALRVLEVNLEPGDTSCLWFDDDSATERAAYVRYDFAACDASDVVGVQSAYQGRRNSSFVRIQPGGENVGLPDKAVYDLVILKSAPRSRTRVKVDALIEQLASRVSDAGYILSMQPQREPLPALERAGADDQQTPDEAFRMLSSPETPGTPGSVFERSRSRSPETPASSITTRAATPDLHSDSKRRPLELKALEQKFLASGTSLQISLEASGFGRVLHQTGEKSWSLYASGVKALDARHARDCCVVRLSESTPALSPAAKTALGASGWKVSETMLSPSSTDLPTASVYLVLDDMQHGSVLAQADAKQWDALKTLASSGKHVLWVTKGAQYKVTDPGNALVVGLFRVARREDPSAKLSVLDVESGSGDATAWAIDAVLGYLGAPKSGEATTETEFVERDGILYVHRLVPDTKVNRFSQDVREGAVPVVKSLHDTKTAVQLRAERLGTFQSLMWCETEVEVSPVDPAKVEVEIAAVGVNFKDVAVTMGIVPENEYALGYEAAGVVTRLGPGVTKFKVGDRVCFLNSGSYANRLQVPVGRAHTIPSWMSFKEAATIPSVYLCSIYSLYDVANLRPGQSVLIHSASGGVGIACIQLAQHKKAEIFVTVGTDEKRKFLAETYGIPYSHMFSSRNAKFADEIVKATNGRGVDVIINSLTGELLDASWRICADGGTMVEIGKKDIVDRNSLAMEPFDRNCSFRAMDFSFTKDISDPLIARLLDQIFDLVHGGHIKPIQPITTFGFDAVPEALAYIRSGRHLGKVVVSDEGKEAAQVPIRPATRALRLRADAAYLIVGGLKGLCGSLAVHMARHGARHIVVCSRSGIADDASQKVVANCLAYGCGVTAAMGDVADMGLLREAFAQAPKPIAGVIQGAMMLRDKPYETMTVDDWHAALHAKVHGTWGLHRIAQEQAKPLDFFTMLSSISGIVGNKGQSNYAAANTFLDAFALYRQSLGLAANSVALGLIEDVGYIAEQEHDSLEARFDKRQWTPIGEATLRRILTVSVLQQDPAAPIDAGSSTQLITGIGFPLPRDSDLAGEGRFGYLMQGEAAGGAGDGDDVQGGNEELRELRLLRKSAPDDVAALVKAGIRVLAGQLAKILRLGDETGAELEPAKPLMALGLDSLAAVELRNWVRAELGAELTTLDITGASSLTALCEKMVSKLPAAAS